MKIRRAQEKDMKDLDRLLFQVNMVHHKGRPDLFKAGQRKYTDDQLREIIQDDRRPVFVAENEEGNVVGYAFCIFQQRLNDNILTGMRHCSSDGYQKPLYRRPLCGRGLPWTARGQRPL